MSYYDWVNTIESLKTLPRDEEIIKNLKNKEIEDNKYVLARLIVHIYELSILLAHTYCLLFLYFLSF